MSLDAFNPITREQAASILSISLSTLDAMIKKGVLPPPKTLGGKRRLYWYPPDFYGSLYQSLAPARSDSLQPVAQSPAPATPAPEPAAPAPAQPIQQTRELDLKPTRTRGSANVRARQAARLKKLNE